MHEPNQWTAVAALGAYNLIQNFLVPPRYYVAANLGVGLGMVGLARRQGCSWDDLGLSLAGWRRALLVGGAGAALTVAAAAAATAHPEGNRYLLDTRAQSRSGRDLVYRSLVRFPIGTALFEEVAFRGVVYAMWRRAGRGEAAATAAAATAFGVWHLVPSRNALTGNPLGERLTSRSSTLGVVAVGALLTGLSGWGLTWLRRRSGSLIAPWVIHAALNAVTYLAGAGAWRRVTAPMAPPSPSKDAHR